MNDNPLVSIVIPTYNRKTKLIRLIRSIQRNDYKNIEIIVIDDVSTDGTYDAIKDMFPEIKIIKNEKEILLAGSRNVGISHSSGELIFFVDDDNIMGDNTISELVKVINIDHIAIVQPIIYYFEEPNKIWCAGIDRNMTTSLTKFIGKDQIDCGQFKKLIESKDSPNSFMIKRNIIQKIGMFDDKNFPIHYDEADFGERVRNIGYSIVCNPKSKIWHDIRKIKDKTRLFHIYNERRAYYAARNRILFHRKYSTKWQVIIFLLIFNWIFILYYSAVILTSRKNLNEKTGIIISYFTGTIEGLYE